MIYKRLITSDSLRNGVVGGRKTGVSLKSYLSSFIPGATYSEINI
jgi:hypothetical protein